MVTLKDIANNLNLSYSTVSAVMRDRIKECRINPETSRLVREKAAQMGYVPNISARGLRTGRSFLIGALVPAVYHNTVVPGLLQGMDSYLTSRHIGILLCTYNSLESIREKIDFMVERNIDGAVIMPDERPEYEDAKMHLTEAKKSVGVGSDTNLYQIPWVYTDATAIGTLAVNHLLELGHRQILYLGKRKGADEAITRITQENGLMLYHYQGLHTYEHGREAVQRMLEEHLPITAVIAHNDENAAGIIAEATRRNISIPGELSIIGINGSPLANMITPALTSVEQPFLEQGWHAAELLVKLLKGDENPANISLQPRLIVRESTGQLNAGLRLMNNKTNGRTEK